MLTLSLILPAFIFNKTAFDAKNKSVESEIANKIGSFYYKNAIYNFDYDNDGSQISIQNYEIIEDINVEEQTLEMYCELSVTATAIGSMTMSDTGCCDNITITKLALITELSFFNKIINDEVVINVDKKQIENKLNKQL